MIAGIRNFINTDNVKARMSIGVACGMGCEDCWKDDTIEYCMKMMCNVRSLG